MPDTAYCCAVCADRLARDLTVAAELMPELVVTVARLDRIGQGGRGNGENPLPVNLEAAEAEDAVNNTFTTWARHVSEERGKAIDGEAAAWLAGQTGWLRYRPEAEEAFDELDYACRLVRRTIDIPVPRWYAGPCACGSELYAATLAATVRCQDCGATYDARERKAWLLEQARDVLAHAGWIASAASALGEPVTADMIYGYVRRGRLLAHGRDQRDRPLYRVGDVLDVLERIAA
jgi:hypothetical protein